MKQRAVLMAILVLGYSPIVAADLMDWLKKTFEGEAATEAATAALSSSQIVDGLKEALIKGVDVAIDTLGEADGFMGNEEVRIALPESVKPATDLLEKLGQDKYVDDFQLAMNRAAEAAVPEGKALLYDAIRAMDVDDAVGILNGGDRAATDYFQKTAGDDLTERILPIINEATSEVGVTASYKSVISKLGPMAATLGLDTPDLDSYIAEQALEGLYSMIAAQEKSIRDDPVERTTDLLKKVFAD